MDDKMKQDLNDIAILLKNNDDDEELIFEGLSSKESTMDIEKERLRIARARIVNDIYASIIYLLKLNLEKNKDPMLQMLSFNSKQSSAIERFIDGDVEYIEFMSFSKYAHPIINSINVINRLITPGRARNPFVNSSNNIDKNSFDLNISNAVSVSNLGKLSIVGDNDFAVYRIIPNPKIIKKYMPANDAEFKKYAKQLSMVGEASIKALYNKIKTESFIDSIVYDESTLPEVADDVFQENILVSDKDIFYHKNEFKNGDINICFIIGLRGSGKTTAANNIASDAENYEHYDLKYIVNNNGRDLNYYQSKGDLAYEFFSNGPGRKYYGDFEEIKNNLNISDSKYEDAITNAFIDFAISWANHHKNTKYLIEGVYIQRYINPSRFRDYAVYICNSSIARSMYNTARKSSTSNSVSDSKNFVLDNYKLRQYRNMYKSYADKTENKFSDDEGSEILSNMNKPQNTSKKKDDDEYNWDAANEVYSYNDNNDIISMNAFEEYESNINELNNILTEFVNLQLLGEAVLHEANSQDPVNIFNTAWNNFNNKIQSYNNRFKNKINAILDSKRSYLDQHRDAILNNQWGNIKFSYNGNYTVAQQRCLSTNVPEFNYATFEASLKSDGYDAAVRQFMTGHTDFKFNNGANMAEQFKSYFLGSEYGTTNANLSQLNKNDIFNFCYNTNNIYASIQKDLSALERSRNTILQAIQRQVRELGQNTANNGPKTNPVQQPTKNENTILEADTVKQAGSVGQATPVNQQKTANAANQANTVGMSAKDSSKVTNNTNLTFDKEDTKNITRKDKTINEMATKWITISRNMMAGKMTALQIIAKDYMNIINIHVNSVSSANTNTANNNENKLNNSQQQVNQVKRNVNQ